MTQSLRRVRDSQRIRVYRANSAVLGAPLPHMDDVRMFCHDVVTSTLWRTLFPNEKVWKVPPLKPGRGARTAHVLWHNDGRIEIAFPRAYRYSTYVLHELAHFGIGYREDIAPHGPEFVGMFMALVHEFCNGRTSHALERAFAREKVHMHIPLLAEQQIVHNTRETLTHTPEPKAAKKKIRLDQLVLFD